MTNERYVECEICGQTYSGRAIKTYTTETWIGQGRTEECIQHCKTCTVEQTTKAQPQQ